MAEPFAAVADCAGVESLESDHIKMMALVNELYDCVRTGAEARKAAALIDELASHIRAHFACEERLLERIEFPGTVEQRHEHENMTAWIEELRSRFWSGTLPVPPAEAVEYLRDWILEHVVRSDQSFLSELAVREG